MLEIWDWDRAVPTGKAVSREEAHRNGVPHEGVHLWILSTETGTPELLFQMRAPHKEHYPDCLDITVGGHVPWGLTEDKIQKESEEEIGIRPDDGDLVDLGYYRYEEKNEHLHHREFQRVYLLHDSRPLDEYRFNDNEVTGIYAVSIADMEGLFNSDREIPVRYFDGIRVCEATKRRKDFHPQLFDASMKPYMDVVIFACGELTLTGRVSVTMPAPA